MRRGDLDADDRAAVEALVARHIRRHGGPEKSLAAVGVARSTCESLADLGDPDVQASLDQVGLAYGSTQDVDPDCSTSYAVGTTAHGSQRFRVLRPHARGGLGAVFVAFDSELNREVALKQIIDLHADDPISRQRFLLEAEVTGGLEHPGIVPVYALGSQADGRPYYAMRFIRGDSLKSAIDRFHGDESLKKDAGGRLLELVTSPGLGSSIRIWTKRSKPSASRPWQTGPRIDTGRAEPWPRIWSDGWQTNPSRPGPSRGRGSCCAG